MPATLSSSPEQFLDRAGTVASYYGFRPLRDVDPELFRKTVGRSQVTFEHAASIAAGTTPAQEQKPVLAYYTTTKPSHIPVSQAPHTSARDVGAFCLHVAGAPRAIGEVLIIKTISSILSDGGRSPERVRINTFGDRESRERFVREISGFVKKRCNASSADTCFTPEDRERLIGDPVYLYHARMSHIRAQFPDAPRPVHFLSEHSRVHLKELLEYLEHAGLPYEIDDSLPTNEHEPRTVFSFDLRPAPTGNGSFITGSIGGRYDDFAARVAGKRDHSAVHAHIYFIKKDVARVTTPAPHREAPKLYFIQLGLRAQLRGLSVIDTLRQARVPVAQSFDAGSLSPQLAHAQRLNVPYLLIMGEREARDGTVIVRRTSNFSQTAVPVGELYKHLKTLKF